MAHISRKELKKDELRDTLAQGAEAVLSHQSLTLYIVIAAAVIALGFFGWRSYTERQTVKAAAAYNDAMKVFQARVRAPGEPQEPNEVSYVDEKNKYTDAAKKFQDVECETLMRQHRFGALRQRVAQFVFLQFFPRNMRQNRSLTR